MVEMRFPMTQLTVNENPITAAVAEGSCHAKATESRVFSQPDGMEKKRHTTKFRVG